ncbi:MAG: DUF3368 domain-containing protein [bacterium]
MKVWVLDTSPLIFLSSIQRLHLLRSSKRRLFVPEAMYSEAKQQPSKVPEELNQALSSWIVTRKIRNERALNILLANLHRGEAEAILLSQECHAEFLVVHDLEARRYANRCGLVTIGTLGILLAARLQGRISSLREELEKLQKCGFYVKPSIRDAVLSEAGEA